MKDEITLEEYILKLENKKSATNKVDKLKNDFYGFSITPEINDYIKMPKIH